MDEDKPKLDPRHAPWWAASRDKFILYVSAAMFAVLLWSIPSDIAAVRAEHQALLKVVQIMCVHASKTDKERIECLTLRLAE